MKRILRVLLRVMKRLHILDRANMYHELLWEMPPGEKRATAGAEDMHTIKCLLNVHRGELREWSGWWEMESPILNLLEVKWHMI